jgi:hypothetical protein
MSDPFRPLTSVGRESFERPVSQPMVPDPEPELEPLWLKLPYQLAPYFDLGFAHFETDCPLLVFRAMSETGLVEISGPPIAFLGLAEVIIGICKAIPRIAHVHEDPLEEQETG